MTESGFEIRLSLEELAVMMSLIGRPDIAKSMLIGTLGEISEDEERGRLLAANHTLMAKELLFIEEEAPKLNEDFVDVIGSLLQQEYLLRFSAIHHGGEDILAYYVQSEFAVQHQIFDSVIHAFRVVTDVDEMLLTGLNHLGLANALSPDTNISDVEFSSERLDEIRTIAVESQIEAQLALQDVGFSEQDAALLAEDFHLESGRGTVMRIEEADDGTPVSDNGILVLIGESGRAWFFQIFAREEQPMVAVFPFSRDLFTQMLASLTGWKSFVV